MWPSRAAATPRRSGRTCEHGVRGAGGHHHAAWSGSASRLWRGADGTRPGEREVPPDAAVLCDARSLAHAEWDCHGAGRKAIGGILGALGASWHDPTPVTPRPRLAPNVQITAYERHGRLVSNTLPQRAQARPRIRLPESSDSTAVECRCARSSNRNARTPPSSDCVVSTAPLDR
jgi:hypothetical protein